jgi:hypothetical protein
MNFDVTTGALQVAPTIELRRGMTRSELLSLSLPWEVWISYMDTPTVYRAIFPSVVGGGREVLVLSADISLTSEILTGWCTKPFGKMRGPQARPEGKYTKEARAWFKKATGVALPQHGEWGAIDAAHDPHNLTTEIICSYPERFKTDREWKEFLRNNY